jgi:hypothetical protein
MECETLADGVDSGLLLCKATILDTRFIHSLLNSFLCCYEKIAIPCNKKSELCDK